MESGRKFRGPFSALDLKTESLELMHTINTNTAGCMIPILFISSLMPAIIVIIEISQTLEKINLNLSTKTLKIRKMYKKLSIKIRNIENFNIFC